MDFDTDDRILLRFQPSVNTLPVPVEIFDDEIPEDIETFSLFLAIDETKAGFSLGRPQSTIVNIINDDRKLVK